MGGEGSGRKSSSPGISRYWAKFTPEQRSKMMKHRRAVAREKLLARMGVKPTRGRPKFSASSESPFPKSSASGRSLRNLVHDLETVVEELKALFEF